MFRLNTWMLSIGYERFGILIDAFQAAGECRRQFKHLTNLVKKCQNCRISWPYLEPPWEIHWNKYKHAFYLFTNSLNNPFQKCEKSNTILLSKINARVVSVKMKTVLRMNIAETSSCFMFHGPVYCTWHIYSVEGGVKWTAKLHLPITISRHYIYHVFGESNRSQRKVSEYTSIDQFIGDLLAFAWLVSR